DRLADVVVLVSARRRADAVAVVADRKTLLRRRADHALRREHLAGGRVDDVDRRVDFTLAAASADRDTADADAAAATRGVVLHVRDRTLDQELCRRHLAG